MKKVVFLMLLSMLLAVYFRLPLWKDLPQSIKQKSLREAETIVREKMTERLKMTAHLPGTLSDADKDKIIQKKVQQVFKSDSAQFDIAVGSLQEQINDGLLVRYSKEHLQEADPYYYLSLTKNILEKGEAGASGHNGTFYNPLRCAPQGTWDRATLHPYIGAVVYRLMQVFDKDITLTRAVAYVPVVLTILMVLGIFFLLSALEVRPFLTWLGSTAFLLLPAVVLRSNYGWYDTDPYILFFSSVILGSLFLAVRTPEKALWCGIGGGMFTGLFAAFWHGWLYMVPLIGIGSLALIVLGYVTKNRDKVQYIKYLAVYGAVSLVSVIVLMSPQSFWWTVFSGAFLSTKNSGGGDLWPNLLLLISETNAPSVKEWFFLLGPATLSFAALGLFAAGPRFVKEKNELRFRQWLVAVSLCVPLMVLSSTAKRFVFLVTPSMILLSVLGMEWFMNFLRDKVLTRFEKTFREALTVLAVIVCVLPVVFLNAGKANDKMNVIMDQQWFKVLNYLQKETPADAIVFSSWSPGYFINGVARRRSVVDGGSQNHHENFWIAKALLSHDERQSLGIFRMLAASGDQAFGYLKKLGMSADDAVALLMKIAPLDRGEALGALPSGWKESDKSGLLALTHPEKKLPPVYLLVYSDLVENNVVLQQANCWNFKRAEKVFGMQQAGGLGLGLGSEQAVQYFRKVNVIVGAPVPYQSPKPAVYTEKDYLIYKDLIIDRVEKSAFMPEKGKAGMEMRPISLIYRQDGKWVFKPVSDSPSAVWAVSFDMDDPQSGRKVMLARRELLDSVLFQLFYFGGENYRSMKPVTSEGSFDDANYVRVFRVDLSAPEQKNEAVLP
jgi:dolichyl-diphosphooligosaccharide--protein glycosyltransferase